MVLFYSIYSTVTPIFSYFSSFDKAQQLRTGVIHRGLIQ